MYMPQLQELPLVSVVLATYNGENFLKEQLDSVLNQSYPAIEIIIVDDSSTDNTIPILTHFAAKHPSIKLFLSEKNVGYIRNFQKGVQLASGTYIALCDQDDYWLPHKMERLIHSIGNASMIYHDSLLCNHKLESTGKKISDVSNCLSYHSCLQQAVFCRIYGHASLFKTSLLKKALPFPEVLPHDWWLSFIATLENGIQFLPEVLVYYRQHSQNVFGAVGGSRKKNNGPAKKLKKQKELIQIKQRVNIFSNTCPEEHKYEKMVLRKLENSYQNFSIINNFKRVLLFIQNKETFLAVKKRTGFRKWLFCIKMFFMLK